MARQLQVKSLPSSPRNWARRSTRNSSHEVDEPRRLHWSLDNAPPHQLDSILRSPNAKARGELAPSFPLPASAVHCRRPTEYRDLELKQVDGQLTNWWGTIKRHTSKICSKCLQVACLVKWFSCITDRAYRAFCIHISLCAHPPVCRGWRRTASPATAPKPTLRPPHAQFRGPEGSVSPDFPSLFPPNYTTFCFFRHVWTVSDWFLIGGPRSAATSRPCWVPPSPRTPRNESCSPFHWARSND